MIFYKTFLFLTFIIGSVICYSQEVYNVNGNPIIYYNANKNVFFDYSGTPLYYISYSNNKRHIYNFKGEHIGWREDKVFRDHAGKIMASYKDGLSNIIYKIQPIKPIEQIIPIKAIEQIPPIVPIWRNESSNYALAIEKLSTPTVFSTPNDYSTANTFQPYSLPVDDIIGALKTLNAREEEMNRRGFVYDPRTDNYMKREDFIARELEIKKKEEFKKNQIWKSIFYLLDLTNSMIWNFKKEDYKDGWYYIAGTSEFEDGKVRQVRCKIKDGRVVIIQGFYGSSKYKFKCDIPMNMNVYRFSFEAKAKLLDRLYVQKVKSNGYLLFAYSITPEKK
jgi:hypothetical protein